MGIELLIGGLIAGAVSSMGVGAGVLAAGGLIMTGVGIAAGLGTAYGLKKATSAIFGGGKKASNERVSSPSFSFGPLATQTNSSLPLPTVYGETLLAGNTTWQDGTDTIKRLVSFCEGEIDSFSQVKLNNIVIGDIADASYSAYTGDGTQSIDSRVTGATQEDKAALVGGLRHEAYLAFTITANEQVNNDFNVTALVKGKKVRVYSDTSTYVEQWSDNPAWCLLDFLTGYNSIDLDHSEINIQSFITAANYCDQLVDDTNKRFRLNLAIDAKQSVLEWVLEILKTMQGIFSKKGDEWHLIIDKPESVSKILTNEDVEEVQFWWLPMEEVFDVVQLQFRDADNDFAFVQARAEADTFLRSDRPFIKTQDLMGVTSFNQASRQAYFYLNQSTTCQQFIRFKVSKTAFNCTFGDVIEYTDYIQVLYQKKYRILKMSEIQDDYIEIIGREYNPNIYTDTLGSVAATINDITPVAKVKGAISTVETSNLTANKIVVSNGDGKFEASSKSTSDLEDIHSHSNKATLDTYTQTEANLADAVTKKHEHSNKDLLDSIDFNSEILSASRTLVEADVKYQNLDANGANRDVNLDTTDITTAKVFVINNTATYAVAFYLSIKQGGSEIDRVYAGARKSYIFNGTNWTGLNHGSSGTSDDGGKYNLALGHKARANNKGVAVGYLTDGNNFGVGLGYSTNGSNSGVAIGFGAYGVSGMALGQYALGSYGGTGLGSNVKAKFKSVAVGNYAYASNISSDTYNIAIGSGDDANTDTTSGDGAAYTDDTYDYEISIGYDSYCSADNALALGTHAKATKKFARAIGGDYTKVDRTTEMGFSCDGSNKFRSGIDVIWSGTTADATPTEIYLGGVASEQFTITASSVVTFDLLVSAIDTTSGDVASYQINGSIKRDNSNNTTLNASNKTVIHEDDSSWDVAVSGDDTNEALIIQVTGDASNSVKWVVSGKFSEVIT